MAECFLDPTVFDPPALFSLSGSSLNAGNYEAVRRQLTTRVVVICDRCGHAADGERMDVSALGDPERRYVYGRLTCHTPGCVDEHGSSAVEPPNEPGQLTREDRKWLRRQREFLAEYERVVRAFAAIDV